MMDRNSRQMALISVVPTVRQIALPAFFVVVVVAAAAELVVAAGNLCQWTIAPNYCKVLLTLAAICRSAGHACSRPTSDLSPGTRRHFDFKHLF